MYMIATKTIKEKHELYWFKDSLFIGMHNRHTKPVLFEFEEDAASVEKGVAT